MREIKLLLLIAIGMGVAIGAGADLTRHLECGLPGSPAARVLIFDNSLNRPVYQPVSQWRRYLHGAPVDAVHMPTVRETPSLDGYTHIIITGSTASLVDPPEWAKAEADLVREAQRRGLAILGSCFGYQMLAYALSGPAHVAPAKVAEIGWVAVQMSEDDPLFIGLPEPWHAFAWHDDEVVDLPPPWRILGSTSSCEAAVIRYGDEPIWGIQLHPEYTPCEAKTLMLLQRLFRGGNSIEICVALCQQPHDDKVVGVLVDRFLAAGPTR